MYRAIVAALTRRTWRQIDAREFDRALKMMNPAMQFRFLGTTPLSANLTGRDEFRRWFEDTLTVFPDLRFDVRDVAVGGWPWRTRVAVRVDVSATLADGTPYNNELAQWLTLRWGKLVDDWVLEDTEALRRACAINGRAGAGGDQATATVAV